MEFLQGIPSFRGLRLDMTEDALQRHVQQYSLVGQRYDEGDSTSYHLFAEDGENVIVMFRDGQCSGIQRMRPDRQGAARLYEEKRRAPSRSSEDETQPADEVPG